MKAKLLLPLILVAIFLLGACTPQSCPTYSRANFIAPIEEQPATRTRDTAWVDSKRYLLYEQQDTAQTKPQRRYPFIERAAMVGAAYLLFSAVKSQTE